jgi:transcriptional regulator with XRE-family HTH domain
MPSQFSENLKLVLKLLSLSPATLAASLRIDKSVISRWLNGSVRPSQHNLARLSALVAARVEGFTVLDWERDPASLGSLFGAELPAGVPAHGLPLAIWDEMIASAATLGRAYLGFFRTTRPHPAMPGRFLHDHALVQANRLGVPSVVMGSTDSYVEGWLMPLNGLIYAVAAEARSGTLLFGIFNGTGASRLDVLDGIVLIPAARTPTATPILCERIGDLSGDDEADRRRFDELITQSPLAPEGSVPDAIAKHLLRDIGPEQYAKGGDLLLSLTLWQSMTRGRG